MNNTAVMTTNKPKAATDNTTDPIIVFIAVITQLIKNSMFYPLSISYAELVACPTLSPHLGSSSLILTSE